MPDDVCRATDSKLLDEARDPTLGIKAAHLFNVVPVLKRFESHIAQDEVTDDVLLGESCVRGLDFFKTPRTRRDRHTATITTVLLDVVPHEHASIGDGNGRRLDREVIRQVAPLRTILQPIYGHLIVHLSDDTGRVFNQGRCHLRRETFRSALYHDHGTTIDRVFTHLVAAFIQYHAQLVEPLQVSLGNLIHFSFDLAGGEIFGGAATTSGAATPKTAVC